MNYLLELFLTRFSDVQCAHVNVYMNCENKRKKGTFFLHCVFSNSSSEFHFNFSCFSCSWHVWTCVCTYTYIHSYLDRRVYVISFREACNYFLFYVWVLIKKIPKKVNSIGREKYTCFHLEHEY